MAEKLRSILRRISWSSVLKAVLFAVAWWALPFWLFFLVALYLYFVPITGASKVAAPFLVLVLAAFMQGQSILAAIIFGIIFYFILLIKDLIIIDRRSAFEILMLVLSYLLMRSFFLNVGASFGLPALMYSIVDAWAMSALLAAFIKHFSAAPVPHAFRRMLGWVAFMLLWQLLIVGSFLPLNFLYQSAVVFLAAVVLFDIVPQYVSHELTRTKALVTGTVLFSLLVIVLASASWAL